MSSPLVIQQGADWDCAYQVCNPDGSPVNLRGFQGDLTIATDFGVTPPILHLSRAAGTLNFDDPTGWIRWRVLAAVTAGFSYLPFPRQLNPCEGNIYKMGVSGLMLTDSGGRIFNAFVRETYLRPAV